MKFVKLLVSCFVCLLSPKAAAEAVNNAVSISDLDRDFLKRI